MSDGRTGPEEEQEPRVVIRDKRRIDPETGDVRQPAGAPPAGAPAAAGAPSGDAASWSAAGTPAPGDSAEAAELRTQVAERTADLQRVTAEYANYRKRVDRDRVAVVDTATASVLGSLLPVLDDLDRAAEHGDLAGPFKAVADQLQAVLSKLGLESFGAPGDPFDPIVHEAVMHSTSAEVSQPTAVQVMRRGYRHGERLIRPAMVAVAEPEHNAPAGDAPPAGWTAPGTEPQQSDPEQQ
ncbi:MAG TPA: nucleotide exchange factor GrpE [Mycobacteriales bacterium]|nr:nucleotide exchange factor GrpE [Mycobacteriales bacterium]